MRPLLGSLLVLFVVLTGCSRSGDETAESASTPTAPDSALRATVEREIEALNTMRSQLATTISGDESVDQQTFARVCKPVGKRAKEMAAQYNWVVQQVAERYRNPAHELDPHAEAVSMRFRERSDLVRHWTRTTRDGTPGWRYFRRITVEPSCLACHGAKEERPAFVKENYPEDRAYGFEAGDLRGLYAVFVPDSLR